VVLAVLAGRVVAGDTSAPTLVALIVAAGLVSLLAPVRTEATPSRVGALPLLVALVLVLAANLVVLGDLARLLGLAGVYGVAAGAALTLAVACIGLRDRWSWLATAIGVLLVMLPLAAVVTWAGAPWTAWKVVASRSALTFGDGSGWVTKGRALGATPLTFLEPHRVVAGTSATWRVVERDTSRVAVREWRLGAGDALMMRPGDELAVDAGARVRFQAGRRIPGAPASGMLWADGRPRATRETLIAWTGVAVTLVGGGLALAPAGALVGAPAIVAPAMLLAFTIGAALWGVYGIALAPDLSLVPRAFAPLLEVATRLAKSHARDALLTVVVTGVAVLFVGLALAWRTRLAALFVELGALRQWPAPSPFVRLTGTAALVAVASALAMLARDHWAMFSWGLGLAAAAVAAPRLAAAGQRGEIAGAIVGTVTFVAVLACAGVLPPFAAGLAAYPALAAAPLAWLAARLAGEGA
jgi:hypothetical protein